MREGTREGELRGRVEVREGVGYGGNGDREGKGGRCRVHVSNRERGGR